MFIKLSSGRQAIGPILATLQQRHRLNPPEEKKEHFKI
jgi:hypothetical protein